MCLLIVKEKYQALPQNTKKTNKNVDSATTGNSQCVTLHFVKKTQDSPMNSVPPRNLSSNWIKRYLSALPFPPALPTARIVRSFEMRLSLMLTYAGFFLYRPVSPTWTKSQCVYLPCQCGCELVCCMLNTGSKNYLISLRESNLLPCSGGKVHVTVQISLAESVRLNSLVKNLILDDTHPSVFPQSRATWSQCF